jgi:hypothetical protein
MGRSWRHWLPVAMSIAGIGTALALADAGRQSGALVLLGASLILAGVSVGVWIKGRDDDDEGKWPR